MTIKNNLSMDHKIVLSNDLVTNYREVLKNVRQMKYFRLIVSCIDTNNPSNTVYLSKKELWSYYEKEMGVVAKGLTKKAKYHTLQYDLDAIRIMAHVSIIPGTKKQKVDNLVKGYTWSLDDHEDLIEIRLNEDVLPLFCELKNSLRYMPLDIVNFKCIYTLPLYEYLLAEKWKNKPISIPIAYWKEKTATTDKYERFDNWYNKVIKIAINEINKTTPYQVSCTKWPTEKTKAKVELIFVINEKKQLENTFQAEVTTHTEKPNNFIYDRWQYYEEFYRDIPYGSQAVERVKKSFDFYFNYNGQEIDIDGQLRSVSKLKDSLSRCKPSQIEEIIKRLIDKHCNVKNETILKWFYEMDRNVMFEKYRREG